MADYEKGDQTFVNPYNFVPLEEGCKRPIDYKDIKKQDKLLTGWIECSLETLTPIFIPNTTNDDAFSKRAPDGKSYDFYSYKNLEGVSNPPPSQPVIPGSEIRGMIRTAFEALTNSCLSTIDDDQLLYKRTTIPGKPGRLECKDGRWEIIPCERIGIAFKPTPGDKRNFEKTIAGLKEGQPVYIVINGRYRTRKGFDAYRVVADIKKADEIKEKEKAKYTLGYFHKGEPFGSRKHHESVFIIEKQDGETIELPRESVENLWKNIKLYQDDTINIHKKTGQHKGYKHIDISSPDKLNGALVYYTKHNGEYYLSPAHIGREIFYNKLSKIIGNYAPCTKIDELCPACALFGIAGKGEGKDIAAASRVRFTDGIVPEDKQRANLNDYFEDVKILPELASPKLSATEFYLNNIPAGADLWNYDYAIKWERNRDGRVTKRYDDISPYTPSIRGRKFYWHQNIPSAPSVDQSNASERNVAVRPLTKGNQFSFRVYFNDITKEELKQLAWVLEIGGNETNAHKIGMGKPVGLGSVKITVQDVMLRTIEIKDDSIEYKIDSTLSKIKSEIKNQKAEDILGCSTKVKEDYLKITDYKNPPDNVSYPVNENDYDKKVYEWFVANKKARARGGGGTGTSPVITQPLPPVISPELKKYRKIRKDKRGIPTCKKIFRHLEV